VRKKKKGREREKRKERERKKKGERKKKIDLGFDFFDFFFACFFVCLLDKERKRKGVVIFFGILFTKHTHNELSN